MKRGLPKAPFVPAAGRDALQRVPEGPLAAGQAAPGLPNAFFGHTGRRTFAPWRRSAVDPFRRKPERDLQEARRRTSPYGSRLHRTVKRVTALDSSDEILGTTDTSGLHCRTARRGAVTAGQSLVRLSTRPTGGWARDRKPCREKKSWWIGIYRASRQRWPAIGTLSGKPVERNCSSAVPMTIPTSLATPHRTARRSYSTCPKPHPHPSQREGASQASLG